VIKGLRAEEEVEEEEEEEARGNEMDAVVKAVIEAIHASPTHAVLYLSGGGSQALGWLLSVPRASGTVLEVTVPYSRASMVQLLGKV
jgi:hypothetical protein